MTKERNRNMVIKQSSEFLNDINQRYFNRGLSADFLAILAKLETYNNPKYFEGVDIILSRYRQAGLGITELSPHFVFELAEGLPRNTFLDSKAPFIPPITTPDRHMRIDQLIASLPVPSGTRPCLLDLGCGFPPITTVEAAERLSNWNVIGVDPSFYPYLVTNNHGYYGCFDGQENLRFMWSDALHRKVTLQNSADEITKIREDIVSAAKKLFAKFKTDKRTDEIEIEGYHLFCNPFKLYTRPNVTFMTGKIGSVEIDNIAVARLFNVSVYYDETFRLQTLDWISKILKEGGMFFCGTDWIKGLSSAYFTYKKADGVLNEVSFSFSIDCLYPLRPWIFFSMHRSYAEKDTLIRYLKILREDKKFINAFDSRFVKLVEEHGLGKKDPQSNRWLPLTQSLDLAEFNNSALEINELLEKEGYVDQAVLALRSHGIKAECNAVNLIEVKS